MDIFCGEKFKNETRKAIVEQKLETQQKELKKWLIRDDIASLKKTELNKLFYLKYNRFIQEGSWSSEEYIDDELYYLDASSVLYNSIFPKITYTINVIDYSMLEEYKIFNFKIGERTYIEDTEFFGYNKNGAPYWEEVVITETIRHLGDPSKNSFKVQNFTTQYEDLFSRITATV
jgi:hypothetical protein